MSGSPGPAGGGGAAGRPPDLLFCRRCGGSIARRDLLAGRARLLEDRAYCAACAPEALALRKGVRAALFAAGGSVAVLLGWECHALSLRAAETESRAEAARRAAASAEGRIAAVDRTLRDLEAEARGLRLLVEAAGKSAEAARTESRESREAIEDRVQGAEQGLAALLEAIEGIRKETAWLSGPPRLTEAREKELLDRLLDPNSGARFEALWLLQRGTGPSAREAVVKGLADPEDSVRYMASVLAREMKVAEARPSLVRCLASPSPVVRSAALEALRAMDGTDLGFDPLEPSEAKRAEAVRRWEEKVR